jgi:hypothetical protein
MRPMRVAFYGAGQVATTPPTSCGDARTSMCWGPFGRAQRADALCAGADVVVIATTSFPLAIADDIGPRSNRDRT